MAIHFLKHLLFGIAIILLGSFISPYVPSEIAFAFGFLIQTIGFRSIKAPSNKLIEDKLFPDFEKIKIFIEKSEEERIKYKLMLGNIVGIVHNENLSEEEKIQQIKRIAIKILDDNEKESGNNDNME